MTIALLCDVVDSNIDPLVAGLLSVMIEIPNHFANSEKMLKDFSFGKFPEDPARPSPHQRRRCRRQIGDTGQAHVGAGERIADTIVYRLDHTPQSKQATRRHDVERRL
ncbi:hypothetical protein M5I08_17550 [Candidatus Mycobacterium methanotrophicum]|uniref:Uncharacterized protein n=1 Tax=Candidatus Mycobacterium methanotrophicum TaxID=2943498 RepID=A0ABY4QJM8_9MYCO|nr:hypothetical protein [Candidatus Mycobacterium methanotrophicum]UQX10014.1 hypothetical protein M5I08_17550 [Candidatus Mycobacterium methanotrophicum]